MGRRKIFARYKVPTKKELESDLDERAKFYSMTRDQFLDMYIRGKIGDIADSTEAILREQQKIKKARKCIIIAKAVMNKGASGKAKSVTKKYYNDLLNSAISGIKSKISNWPTKN